MVLFVLVVGILNLVLGCLAAMALADPPLWAGWRLRSPLAGGLALRRGKAAGREKRDGQSSKGSEAASSAAPAEGAVPPPKPTTTLAGVSELPEEWLDELKAAGIVPRTFVEGAMHALRLEVGRYREQLVAAEIRGRAQAAAADRGGLELLARDLRFVNEDWLEKQTSAVQMLAQRAGGFGEHAAAADALEQVLLDQAAEIRTICGVLEAIDPQAEAQTGGKQLLEQTALLLNHVHTLRDRMLDLLATLLQTGQRLAALGDASQFDVTASLPNRLGLEALFQAWWRDDPERSRPLGVAMMNIDRFARLNQRLGTRSCDRAIAALARLCDEVIRKDRGYDRLARIGGDSLLFVMGDTGPRQGLTAAERLRQTVAATTFDNHGTELELTVSCGVIEVGKTETVSEILRRAHQALLYAKKAGRNRCAIDEGNGPVTIEPPQFPVKGRIVKLGDE